MSDARDKSTPNSAQSFFQHGLLFLVVVLFFVAEQELGWFPVVGAAILFGATLREWFGKDWP